MRRRLRRAMRRNGCDVIGKATFGTNWRFFFLVSSLAIILEVNPIIIQAKCEYTYSAIVSIKKKLYMNVPRYRKS